MKLASVCKSFTSFLLAFYGLTTCAPSWASSPWALEIRSKPLVAALEKVQEAVDGPESLDRVQVLADQVLKSSAFRNEPQAGAAIARIALARALADIGSEGYQGAHRQLAEAEKLATAAVVPEKVRHALLIELLELRANDNDTDINLLLESARKLIALDPSQVLAAIRMFERRPETTLANVLEPVLGSDSNEEKLAISLAELFGRVCVVGAGSSSSCMARALYWQAAVDLQLVGKNPVPTVQSSLKVLDELANSAEVFSPRRRIGDVISLARKARRLGHEQFSSELLNLALEQAKFLASAELAKGDAKVLATQWNMAASQILMLQNDPERALSVYENSHAYASRIGEARQAMDAAAALASLQIQRNRISEVARWREALQKQEAAGGRLSRADKRRLSDHLSRVVQMEEAMVANRVPGPMAKERVLYLELPAFTGTARVHDWLESLRAYSRVRQLDAIDSALATVRGTTPTAEGAAEYLLVLRAAELNLQLGQVEAAQRHLVFVTRTERREQRVPPNTRARAHVLQGELSLRQGHFEEAGRAFDHAVSISGVDDPAVSLRASYGSALSSAYQSRTNEAQAALAKVRSAAKSEISRISLPLLEANVRAAYAKTQRDAVFELEAGLRAFSKAPPNEVGGEYFRANDIAWRQYFRQATSMEWKVRGETTVMAEALESALTRIVSGRRSSCASDLNNSHLAVLSLSTARALVDSIAAHGVHDSGTLSEQAATRRSVGVDEYEAKVDFAAAAMEAGNRKVASDLFQSLQQDHSNIIDALPRPTRAIRPADQPLERLRAVQIERMLATGSRAEVLEILRGRWARGGAESSMPAPNPFFGAADLLVTDDRNLRTLWNPEVLRRLPQNVVYFVEGRLSYAEGRCNEVSQKTPVSLAFVVKDGRLVHIIRGPAVSHVRDQVSLLYKSIAERRGRADLIGGEALFRELLGPALKTFADDTDVVVVPTGSFARVPFALLDGLWGQRVKSRSVLVVPDAATLSRLQALGGSDEQASVFADPDFGEPDPGGNQFNRLAGSGLEGSEVTGLLSGRLLSRESASLFNLITVRRPSVLHLATHSYSEGLRGLGPSGDEDAEAQRQNLPSQITSTVSAVISARLALANANRLSPGLGDSGVVSGFALSGLDLVGTRLVVFSSCQSLATDASTGVAVTGLSLSAHRAGAKTVVATLWKVDDLASRAVMNRMYTHLLKGVRPSIALRLAQSDMQTLPEFERYRSPHFWGAYVVSGTDEPIVRAR